MAGTNLSSRDGQLGPGLIGAFATLVLYGILTDQTYSYYRNYPRDHTGNKVLVAVVWILDSFNVVTMGHAAYFYLVKDYGDPNPFAFATWSLVATLLLNVVVAFIVQIYFTLRIFDVSAKNWWITGAVGVLVVAHLAFGMENVIRLFVGRNIGFINSFTLSSAVPWAVFSVTSDIAISATLCWLLSSKRTGFKDTNGVIDSLMIYAINRCVLTCAVAILEIIIFAALPASLGFIGVDLVTGKLYSNSLMATLNSRSTLRARSTGRRSGTTSESRSGPTIDFASGVSLDQETAEMFGVSTERALAGIRTSTLRDRFQMSRHLPSGERTPDRDAKHGEEKPEGDIFELPS